MSCKKGRLILAICVIIFLSVFSICNVRLLKKPVVQLIGKKIEVEEFIDDVHHLYVSDELIGKNFFVNLNGLYARLIGKRVHNKMIRTKNGMLTESKDALDMTQQADKIDKFVKSLKENRDIPFVYIQAPFKTDVNNEMLPDGISCFANQNADELLKILKQKKVSTLDLRPNISATPELSRKNFYLTDHHWNYTGAFLGFRNIMEYLQQLLPDSDIDLTYTNPNMWEEHVLEQHFLGSQGKRVGKYFSGIDDFVYYTPKFETHISFVTPKHRRIYKGTFSDALIRNQYIYSKNYFKDSCYCLYVGGGLSFSTSA